MNVKLIVELSAGKIIYKLLADCRTLVFFKMPHIKPVQSYSPNTYGSNALGTILMARFKFSGEHLPFSRP